MRELLVGAWREPPAASLPEGWRAVRLGQVARVAAGGRLSLTKERDYCSSGHPAFSAAGQDGFVATCEYEGDGVVLSAIGAQCGKCFLATGRWTTLANTQVILPSPGQLDARFLFYRANVPYYWPRSGSAQPFVKPSDIPAAWLALPPIQEQRRIAEVLDGADEAIRGGEALVAKLKSAKEGLLTSLVSAEVPPERAATLRDLAVFVTSGSRGWARYYSESGPVFLRIGNLTREHINLRVDDLVHVMPPPGGEGSRTRVLPGDLLISITADLGIIGVVPDGLGEGYVNQHIALVRLDTEKINPRWAAYFLAGPTGASRFRRLNDMGAKAGLNLPTLSKLTVSVPPRPVQDAAVAVLDAADIRIRAEERCVSKLNLQKQGLLQDLLTGRVRVNARAKKVPAGFPPARVAQ